MGQTLIHGKRLVGGREHLAHGRAQYIWHVLTAVLLWHVQTGPAAFFDLLELDEKSLKTEPYATGFEKLSEILPKTGLAHVVETELVRSKNDIEYLFEKWVEEEGGEGLVVRGEMPFIYKIKPNAILGSSLCQRAFVSPYCKLIDHSNYDSSVVAKSIQCINKSSILVKLDNVSNHHQTRQH